ncbi:hypothetical protein M0R45_020643 [Rubus argutus]|uniref:Secreted protein n=1 Tax=Rubus argutus TaxID=59490 RepID=A0AAW1XAJ5_RUBAR
MHRSSRVLPWLLLPSSPIPPSMQQQSRRHRSRPGRSSFLSEFQHRHCYHLLSIHREPVLCSVPGAVPLLCNTDHVAILITIFNLLLPSSPRSCNSRSDLLSATKATTPPIQRAHARNFHHVKPRSYPDWASVASVFHQEPMLFHRGSSASAQSKLRRSL